MLVFDNVIAGGAADDVEHFQDRHAAADELRKGARETRHANLVNERPKDRQLQLPAIAELLAACGTQESSGYRR